MSELKRYSLFCGTDSVLVPTHVHEVELDDGEWCRYEDVERVLNVLSEQLRRESVEWIEAQRKLQLYTEEFRRDHNEMVAEVDVGRIRRAELHQQLDEAEAFIEGLQKEYQEIVIDHLLGVLNRAVKADRKAIAQLLAHRVPCNQALADDPTIQVGSYREIQPYAVGLLGLLSGIAGVHPEDSYSRIAAEYDAECPEHGVHDGGFERCLICGKELVLGQLRGFVRTRVK